MNGFVKIQKNRPVVYKVPYPPSPRGYKTELKFIKSVGEEYKVLNRGIECHA